MQNPIPSQVRLWLYLLGAVVGVIAAGQIVPEQYSQIVIVAGACLNVLAAANVGAGVASTVPDAQDDAGGDL